MFREMFISDQICFVSNCGWGQGLPFENSATGIYMLSLKKKEEKKFVCPFWPEKLGALVGIIKMHFDNFISTIFVLKMQN